MNVKNFFSKWFYISIILILIGLVLSDIESTHKSHQYLFNLASNLLESIGIAIFVANIFTFVIGTEEFLKFIREKLVGIVVSKDFIAKLNQDEQRGLLHMVLKPAQELSSVYSGISDYFNQYIDDSLCLFDTSYRGHMVLDAVASYNCEKKCIQVEFDLDYVIYKVSDEFDSLKLGLEDERFQHIKTVIKGSGDLKSELTDDDAKTIEINDPTLAKMCEIKVPDKFNKFSQINISRKIIEYGEDHWQVFSYKTIKACDQLTVVLRCEDGLIIKKCSTYGVQDRFSIEQEDKKVKISYNDWLSPGFGVNIMVAKNDFHIEQP